MLTLCGNVWKPFPSLGKGVCACVLIAGKPYESVMSSSNWCISPWWLQEIRGTPIFSGKEHWFDILAESNLKNLPHSVSTSYCPKSAGERNPSTSPRQDPVVAFHSTAPFHNPWHIGIGSYSMHHCTHRCDWNPDRLTDTLSKSWTHIQRDAQRWTKQTVPVCAGHRVTLVSAQSQ